MGYDGPRRTRSVHVELNENGGSVLEASRKTPVVMEADVVVCGGGPAGISAALAAAASGAKTVLLEGGGCLGGVWTSGLLAYVLDPKPDSPVSRLLISSLESFSPEKRMGEFDLEGPWARNSFVYDPEIMKWVLEQQCVAHGVHVQLHTHVCDVIRSGEDPRVIEAVLTESKSGRQAWKAKVFIDATGDGDVAAQAGCSYDVGRPDSGEVQPLSLMFLLTSPHPERIRPLSKGGGLSLPDELASCRLKPSYRSAVMFRIRDNLYAFMVNHRYGSAQDAADITRATFEARTEIHETVHALRSQGGRWEGIHVVATAAQIGVREGRRIRGRYEVTAADLKEGVVHEDGICRVNFPIDVHSTNKHLGEAFDIENRIKSQPYDIPLRSLVAADIDNLLMAGRCISGDFLAHSSYRVTGNAVVMGEAAGCLAAASIEEGVQAHELPLERFRLKEIKLAEAMAVGPSMSPRFVEV